MRVEYIGGHIYSLIETDQDGYDVHVVVSVEIEKGKIPFVVNAIRSVTKEELEALLSIVVEVNVV